MALLPPPFSIESHLISPSLSSIPPSSRYILPKSTSQSPTQCRSIRARTSAMMAGKSEARSQIPFSSISQRSLPLEAVEGSSFASSVGSPPSLPLPQWSLGQNRILLLNLTACAVAVSASWLFFSAIPALLAFKRAAESLEKLLDVTAEELPDTMAAVRLSGMEISDLTMELSDLGQEITQGVRSSTRAVRLAEERLRRFTTMAPTVSVQGQANLRSETEGPVLARTARNMREGIVKGRAVLGFIFGITKFSRWALNFLAARRQKRSD